MSQLKVIQNGEARLYSFKGPLLLSKALAEFGYAVSHPCGGRGTCGKCTVMLNGGPVLACRTSLCEDAEVVLPDREKIASVTGAEESGQLTEQVCFCLDIGTTTLALALVSLNEKRIIRTVTAPNPQRAFGADVISRIDHCRKHGPAGLQGLLMKQLQAMIDELLAAFSLSCVETLFAAGNTTMLHLFFGVDCSAMGVSPYMPAFLEQREENARSLGLTGVGKVVSLPGISAFVGADIVAGMEYTGLPPRGKYDMLLDLGTNAEIALFNEEKILCTAAAAGPCFEGANISCGMSASPGAIYACASDGTCSVIGGGEARGICATGLIDAIAQGIRREAIDETGFLEEDPMPVCADICLTGRDIREFQLAKSAIRAAMECLLRREGIAFSDISQFYVAGGFSACLNISNAVFTGLIPQELAGKLSGVNNASLLGTVCRACFPNESVLPLDRAQYVDLSADSLFTQLFMEYMMF